MFEIYSEVKAILSSNVIAAIEGCVIDTIKECVFTATIEPIIAEDEIKFQLCGTLDGILIAKNKLEELINSLHIKRLAKEAKELDSTTFSEENSSLADEGNTSYDKEGTDKTSCLSDDKEQETNASSNGYISTNTESSVKTMRLRPLSKRLRFIMKDRPRVSQRARSSRLAMQLRTSKKKSVMRNKPSRLPKILWNDPDCLSENLQQMKLMTEDSDFDSAGNEDKATGPVRKPCKAKNCDAISAYKHSCEICSFKTKHSSHFMKHMKIHEKVLSCPHCSYLTTKQHYYDRHQRLHCSKRTFLHQCEQCSYKTHRKEHFVRHVNNVHGNLRPYLCHVCGKSFKRADALQQHHITHSEVPSENMNFKCSVCDKVFRTQSHLSEHQAVHSEFRSFLCEVCGASFKTRSVHRKHVQSLHRSPRSHTCDVCFKKFNTQYTLKRHKKIHATKSLLVPQASLEPIVPSVAAMSSFEPSPVTSQQSVDSPVIGSSTPLVTATAAEVLQQPVYANTGAATVLYLQNSMQQL